MGEEFAHGFVEVFMAQVFGKDIAEARMNAWTALTKALGDNLPLNQWQLAQIEHKLVPREKEIAGENEGDEPTTEIEVVVMAEAIFKFNPDGDGGQSVLAEDFPPRDIPGDSLELPKEAEITKA